MNPFFWTKVRCSLLRKSSNHSLSLQQMMKRRITTRRMEKPIHSSRRTTSMTIQRQARPLTTRLRRVNFNDEKVSRLDSVRSPKMPRKSKETEGDRRSLFRSRMTETLSSSMNSTQEDLSASTRTNKSGRSQTTSAIEAKTAPVKLPVARKTRGRSLLNPKAILSPHHLHSRQPCSIGRSLSFIDTLPL